MVQLTTGKVVKALKFDGGTYDDKRDGERLSKQSKDVFNYLKAGNWYTLRALSEHLGYPESSISARLRDFRKPKFGAHTVEKEYIEKGCWKYRLIVNYGKPKQMTLF